MGARPDVYAAWFHHYLAKHGEALAQWIER